MYIDFYICLLVFNMRVASSHVTDITVLMYALHQL